MMTFQNYVRPQSLEEAYQLNQAKRSRVVGGMLWLRLGGSIHTAIDCRQRHENKADKWAIQALVPVDALDAAIAGGCTELWELADLFDVTEDFIKKAVCYYVHGNVASELYF